MTFESRPVFGDRRRRVGHPSECHLAAWAEVTHLDRPFLGLDISKGWFSILVSDEILREKGAHLLPALLHQMGCRCDRTLFKMKGTSIGRLRRVLFFESDCGLVAAFL